MRAGALGELFEALAVRRRLGLELDEGGELGHGLGVAARGEEPLGELAVHVGARGLVLGDAQGEAQDAQDVFVAARGLVVVLEVGDGAPGGVGDAGRGDALEERPRRRSVAPAGEELLGGAQGLGGLVEGVEPQRRDPRPRRVGRVGGEVRQALRPESDQVAEAPVPLVEALQRAGDLRVGVVHRELQLEVADRALGLVGEVLGDVGGLVEEEPAALAVVFGHRLDGRVVEREELAPARPHREQHRQALKGPVGVGRAQEHRAQERLQGLGLARPLVVPRDGALTDAGDVVGAERPREGGAVARGDLVGVVEGARGVFGGAPRGVEGGVTVEVRQRGAEALFAVGAHSRALVGGDGPGARVRRRAGHSVSDRRRLPPRRVRGGPRGYRSERRVGAGIVSPGSRRGRPRGDQGRFITAAGVRLASPPALMVPRPS
ncbi:MAG: hypothetical protein R3A52_07930 [Polyangiales bacterium]